MQVLIISNARNDTLNEYTLNAIESSGQECIVVEQTDTDFPCRTIHYDFPFNYNRCVNLGLSYCSENVCIANNDVLFLPGWEKIEDHLGEYDSLSPVNPEWERHMGLEGVIEGYRIGYELCGWCIVVSQATIQKTGGFDEDVEFWCSDDVWAMQLQANKLKHALVCDSRVIHYTSKTLCSGLPGDLFKRYTSGQVENRNKASEKYIRNR